MKKGFTIGYEKGDTYYRADDEDGCHVSIDYLGNNIITIEAEASEEKTPMRHHILPQKLHKRVRNRK